MIIVLYTIFILFFTLYVGEGMGWAYYPLTIVMSILFALAIVAYEHLEERIKKLENKDKPLPCKVGDRVLFVHKTCDENGNEYLGVSVGKCESISIQKGGPWMFCRYEDGLTYWHKVNEDFGKSVFLVRGESTDNLKEGNK